LPLACVDSAKTPGGDVAVLLIVAVTPPTGFVFVGGGQGVVVRPYQERPTDPRRA